MIPDAVVNRPTYLGLQYHLRRTSPGQSYLTTYAAFERLNAAQSGTAQQLFGQMMQVVSGMSAEKAVQIVEKWSTPRVLFEALEEQQSQAADPPGEEPELDGGRQRKKIKLMPAEEYIAEQVNTGSTRDVKAALSRKVWNLFMKLKYDD